MSINDVLLVECVRAHPEIYDKGNAGFKNAAIKDTAWKIVAETINASVTDCTSRWHTLRERFAKEKRILEQETRSGAAASTRPEWPLYNAMSFLTPHIRKRRSVDNFPKTMPAPTPAPTPSPTSISTDEDTLFPSIENIEILDEQAVQDNIRSPFRVIATSDPLASSSPGCSSLSAGANMPYFGPTGRCKKPKMDETAELFKEALSNLNKSIAVNVSAPSPSIDVNDPDVLIAKNVESCLKSLTNMALKLKYRKKFRALIQDCEEDTENLKILD